MKDSKKEIVFNIQLSEDNFSISSSSLIDEIDKKEKTLLLIALYELREALLNDKFTKKVGTELC
jgi:hypothetical protein